MQKTHRAQRGEVEGGFELKKKYSLSEIREIYKFIPKTGGVG